MVDVEAVEEGEDEPENKSLRSPRPSPPSRLAAFSQRSLPPSDPGVRRTLAKTCILDPAQPPPDKEPIYGHAPGLYIGKR